MISIDQVRVLEQKVKQAIQFIGNLKQENNTLRSRLAESEVRIQELEGLLRSFQDNQNLVESGIQNALGQLDLLDHEGVQVPADDAYSSSPASEQENPVFQDQNSPESQAEVSLETQEDETSEPESEEEPLAETFEESQGSAEEPTVTEESAPAVMDVESVEALIEAQYPETSTQEILEDPIEQDLFGDSLASTSEAQVPEEETEDDEDPQQGLGIF